MRSRPLIVTLFGAVLLSGCATGNGDYCAISRPILFDTQETVDWLIDHDPKLLTDVTVHNEQVERLCP